MFWKKTKKRIWELEVEVKRLKWEIQYVTNFPMNERTGARVRHFACFHTVDMPVKTVLLKLLKHLDLELEYKGPTSESACLEIKKKEKTK